jgi:hypothetical protein
MPTVSAKQHSAMEAAAHGRSTLGIPKKVGQEMVDADKKKKKKPAIRSAHIPAGNTVLGGAK